MRFLFSYLILFTIFAWNSPSYAEILGNMDKVYSDTSHCLVAPEIRGDKDNPISCYCRDAIMDARYIYENYLITGKDRNLNGPYLTLEIRAHQMCGEDYDVLKAIQTKGWDWNGPEVTRQYPSDREIHQIQPDSKGFRTVKYKVHLTYHDSNGHVRKVEDYTALDRLPPNPQK